MICKNCGKNVTEESKFCPECGSVMDGETGHNSIVPSEVNVVEKSRKTYNIGHLGILIGGILTIISAFLENKSGIYVSKSIVGEISAKGSISGNSLVFMLILCIAFTFAMAWFKKNILTIIGAVASMGCIAFMFHASEKFILAGMGYMLFGLGGVVLLISSVLAFNLNRNQQKKSCTDNRKYKE